MHMAVCVHRYVQLCLHVYMQLHVHTYTRRIAHVSLLALLACTLNCKEQGVSAAEYEDKEQRKRHRGKPHKQFTVNHKCYSIESYIE